MHFYVPLSFADQPISEGKSKPRTTYLHVFVYIFCDISAKV